MGRVHHNNRPEPGKFRMYRNGSQGFGKGWHIGATDRTGSSGKGRRFPRNVSPLQTLVSEKRITRIALPPPVRLRCLLAGFYQTDHFAQVGEPANGFL
jgi:hypothetical protein